MTKTKQVQRYFFFFSKLIKRRQQYIGKPIFTQIDTNLNKLFVATDQNVLACLNLRKGNISNYLNGYIFFKYI